MSSIDEPEITTFPPPFERVENRRWQQGGASASRRSIPEETPVALTYDGSTQAVMMATPSDLEDFAVGFSLTEEHIASPEEIRSVEPTAFDDGIDLRVWLKPGASGRFLERRRRIVGPTGCGLCGVDSLSEALRLPRQVLDDTRFAAADILAAQASMFEAQALHAETGAVHAAGFWTREEGLVALREDVGRHNALDKLVGALARQGRSGRGGLLLLTSRVSVELVAKASVLGAPAIVAVSAPTALAVRMAERAGLTLVASARSGGFELFTRTQRITDG
ncbi:formate dehydrogenase accessory sulfurtransferase FdhD [Stappia sp.]|jgi:FdhD protein|uniref:formate dehydrogenase accessory sulfurtransferase FdhD n=1 Tax=Stappia sp. TaxID=1870903 RepID=UPI003A995402